MLLTAKPYKRIDKSTRSFGRDFLPTATDLNNKGLFIEIESVKVVYSILHPFIE